MRLAAGPLIPPLQGLSDARAPLHRQVYARIRTSILQGTFGPGQRLPSTRTLATDLGMSRITVESAFSQLSAEGYLVRRVGAGTFVADVLPGVSPPRRARGAAVRPASRFAREPVGSGLSARGRAITRSALDPEPVGVRVLQPCMPALDQFPHATWARLVSRRARTRGTALLSYGAAAGYRPLREAIADYLASSRGVQCRWDQVVILAGAQQGIELAARLLIDPGDEVWHEEPGYLGARGAFLTAGARVVPIPVDDDGLDVAAGIAAAPHARLAYVTPSHQYPTGATMSLARRLALLAWAERANGWIVEDDYDSEFRYTGRPIASVQGLDGCGRVLYLGSLNKVMFPSLRLAYLVAPPHLVDGVVAARALSDGHPPVLAQAAMTDFIADGHFGAHLRQMRALYQERRDVLLRALEQHVGARLIVGASDAGMHVATVLDRGDDATLVAAGDALGLGAGSLSRQYLAAPARQGLLLGFTGSPPEELRRGVRALGGLLRPRASSRGRRQ
jgi:GntR family transcriptional regulator/MocR family aminotransferase